MSWICQGGSDRRRHAYNQDGETLVGFRGLCEEAGKKIDPAKVASDLSKYRRFQLAQPLLSQQQQAADWKPSFLTMLKSLRMIAWSGNLASCSPFRVHH